MASVFLNVRMSGAAVSALAAVLGAVMNATTVFGQGAPIEFSSPISKILGTNIVPLIPTSPLTPAAAENSGLSTRSPSSALAPVRPAVAPRRRDNADANSGWGLPSTDELIQDYITRQVLKLPVYGPDALQSGLFGDRKHNARKETEDTLVYDLFRELNEDNGTALKSGGSEGINTSSFDLKSWTLKGILERDIENKRSGKSGLYRPDSARFDLSPEAVRSRQEQQVRRDEFKRMLGIQSPSEQLSIGSLLAPRQGPSSPRSLLSPVYQPPAAASLQSAPPALVNASRGTIPSAPLRPLAPSAPLAPGQLDPSALEPLYTPPARPAKPTFATPKRVF